MAIDLFNRKKILFLANEIEKLWYNLSQKEKVLRDLENKPVECFKDGYMGSENTTLSIIGGHVKAIEDYLKISVTKKQVDDPQYEMPLKKQMTIYVASKTKSL